MHKFFFLILLSPFVLISQIPDYSDLSRRDKLKFLNYYGYVQLKSGDTIYCKVKHDFNDEIIAISNDDEAIVSYPKELKQYKYKKKIPLKDIDKLFFGFPKKTIKLVKEYSGKQLYLKRPTKIDLNIFKGIAYEYRKGPTVVKIILEGKYNLYENRIISKYSSFSNVTYVPKTDSFEKSGPFNNQQGIIYVTEWYLQKEDGPLIALYGDREKEENKKILANFLKDDIDTVTFKKLRMRPDRIKDFLTALNTKE
ncbi:hypothetical protein [Spongiimicrobium salis]|uniref:hypothetical protein n=1 Tax=Spongiimicrobium salis TaxID=1667022 RepID=UPI00374D52FE